MELQVEQELADTNESLSDQTCTNQAICGAKMKCEQEMGAMSHDLDEMVAEAHLSEEKAQRAMIDAARLAGEVLRNSDRRAEYLSTSDYHFTHFDLPWHNVPQIAIIMIKFA